MVDKMMAGGQQGILDAMIETVPVKENSIEVIGTDTKSKDSYP